MFQLSFTNNGFSVTVSVTLPLVTERVSVAGVVFVYLKS